MSKYKIPVMIQACASTVIGHVECDSLEEYNKRAEDLWESKDYDSPTANIRNDFDLGDWEFYEVKEDHLECYKV